MSVPVQKQPQPIQKSALVAERIEKSIMAGQFKVGERLPSEAQLGETFSTSRTVIREAIKQLNARGIVQTINGSGSYVIDFNVDELKASLHRYTTLIRPEVGYAEMFDLRIMIEAGCTQMLAENPSDEQLAPVAARVEEMRLCQDDVPAFADADISFHLSIVAATGNQLLIAIHSSLEPMMRQLAANMYRDVRKTSGLFREHAEIYEAMRRGDAAAAGQAMRTHLTGSKEQWVKFTGYQKSYPALAVE